MNYYNQDYLSVLLAIYCLYNLNLNSKQIYNLKNKDFGEKNNVLNDDEEISKLLCNSAMLIKYLSKDESATYVTHYESTCNLKHNKYQIKTFDSASPVDIVGDI